MNDTLNKAEKLVLDFGNLSFDCGEHEDPDSTYYDELLKKERKAKAKILSLISNLVEENEKFNSLANDLHYPECWDTKPYPTLFDAVNEYVGRGCTPPDCKKRLKSLDELTELSQEMGDYE
jgi:hypothetical protein